MSTRQLQLCGMRKHTSSGLEPCPFTGSVFLPQPVATACPEPFCNTRAQEIYNLPIDDNGLSKVAVASQVLPEDALGRSWSSSSSSSRDSSTITSSSSPATASGLEQLQNFNLRHYSFSLDLSQAKQQILATQSCTLKPSERKTDSRLNVSKGNVAPYAIALAPLHLF